MIQLHFIGLVRRWKVFESWEINQGRAVLNYIGIIYQKRGLPQGRRLCIAGTGCKKKDGGLQRHCLFHDQCGEHVRKEGNLNLP
jgi:hypothetical protein